MIRENPAGLRLVAPSSLPPIEEEAGDPAIDESDPPRSSTRRYFIVALIIAIWCSLLACAAYSPAK